MPCTTVTNFCSEVKVTQLLSMVRYQVLLCLDSYDTEAIAITLSLHENDGKGSSC